jgi:hypothetical protein
VSRSSTPVEIELASMIALIFELAGVVSSSVTVPEGIANIPRTLVKTCLQTNPTEEFSGSRTHFETWGTVGEETAGEFGATEAAPAPAAAPVAARRGLVVSRELQAGTDRSAITASTA